MNEELEKTIQELQAAVEVMQDAFRQIGDFAEGLNRLLQHVLTGMSEATVVDLTLTKITELVDQNI